MVRPSRQSQQSFDEINRPVWSEFVHEFTSADAWTDPGERNVLLALAPRIRNARILDVGVGAGRTTWILPLLTERYVAIDYTPKMVEAARRNHPDRDIRVGDARDLREFDDASFDFVMFSYNGIDALAHEDRRTSLAEFRRVLIPGGILMFSTLDKDGKSFGRAPSVLGGRSEKRSRIDGAISFARHLSLNTARYRRERTNWRRLSTRIEDHGEWGVSPLAAQEYGLLVHFITQRGERDELNRLGFHVEAMVDNDGMDVANFSARSSRSFFHIVATRT